MSRLIKAPDASMVQPYDWAPVGALDEQGVHEYRPKHLDADGKLMVEEVPELEPETPPQPAPPPLIDLDEVRKEAFQHGFSEGVESGRQEAAQASSKELQTSLEALRGVAAELAGHKDALRRDVERELVELAFSIARRIIRRELTVDPSTTIVSGEWVAVREARQSSARPTMSAALRANSGSVALTSKSLLPEAATRAPKLPGDPAGRKSCKLR